MSPARVASLGRLAALSGRRAEAASIAVSCLSPAHPRLAARLARDIHTALRGRESTVALRVEDRSEDLGCFLNTTTHFNTTRSPLSLMMKHIFGAHFSLVQRAGPLSCYFFLTF